jgi:predicted O-methyltransferase YrrM
MSVEPTQIDKSLQDYISINFSGEDEFLRNLREEAIDSEIPAINISPEQINYLQALIISTDSQFILEFGSLAGYSSIGMAKALKKGSKLITVEMNKKHFDFTKQKVAQAGLSDIIEVVNKKGIEFLNDHSFESELDIVFADADKNNYINYLDITLPHIRKGGMFIADNAFAFGNIAKEVPDRNPDSVKALKEFNRYMIDHNDLLTTIVPLGDGMIIGVKK